MWDVIIVGAGLAGLVSGIRALKRGKRVLLITEGISSLVYASGALDFGDIAALQKQVKHPYSIFSEEVIHQAFDYLKELCPSYQGVWGQEQAMLTSVGTLTMAGLLPSRLQAWPLSGARRIILVAPAGLKDFFPEIIKVNLEKSYPLALIDIKTVRIERFEPWISAGKSIDVGNMTRFWQTDEGLKTLHKILSEIKSNRVLSAGSGTCGTAVDKTVVIFPSLTAELAGSVEKILAQTTLSVVEMTSFPPTAHGQALYETLKSHFRCSGGEIWLGSRAVRAECFKGVCRRIIVGSKGKECGLEAESFILASGGIFGGGIRVTPHTVRETVFGLPLFIPQNWTQAEFLVKQPYAQTGVEVDEELRPLDPLNGRVMLENLKVVGRTLAHWDPWTEHCGGGVSLTTGYLAAGLL